MFSYTICNRADMALFFEQCRALEKAIPELQKKDLLHDVDDTITQIYNHPKGTVIVKSDTQVDALYVDSEFDLMVYFN